ncbi:secretory carrier-associated membrane protein 1-like [Saccoglossus kowalevskii]|uniref:Secretory carrier-associated membrane protein n=1 Tax=Saccoglossus kowalevskii TaxID=10224 RepID=A0ABM0GJH3_SACKO|nr:PREDICTED: secretory carrier-associated membrane protein 1-like isoform X1 [Saccoglossus kowalevskii]
MSEYDNNPFADPEAAANPWQDPSVQQATTGQRGLEEFNPFAEKPIPPPPTHPTSGVKTTPVVPPPRRPDPSPAVMRPTEEPPAYTPSPAQPPPAQEDLLRRQEELERKAAELQRRENEMKNLNYNPRANNWPPLPAMFPVGPCFYQDFAVDIPLEFQRTVKMCYYLWMFYVCVLFLNFLGALACFCVGGSECGITFGLSIVYLLLFSPCAFVCWYRPVYKAFRSDSSFNFFIYFFIFFCQICTFVFFAIGIQGTGACGWILAFDLIGEGTSGEEDDVGQIVVGVIVMFVGVLFTGLAIIGAILLKKVHSMYRTTGASFAKAQQEFASNVATNQAVQTATTSAMKGAVSGAMSGGTAPSGNRM